MTSDCVQTATRPLPGRMIESLRRMGLIAVGETVSGAPLAGGVSSDIWRADLKAGPVCVKSALPQLKVAAEWHAPIERNIYEARWFEIVGRIAPDAVPRILGQDTEAYTFAMDYLEPARFPVWKTLLSQGHADLEVARAVGQRLAAIHAATAGCDAVRRDFATGAIFRHIRLDPYLGAAALAHPDRAAAIMDLLYTTAGTRLALVHGDVSPKNILAGPCGPVFLDAECAWYGDPAFDLAFCLNHLLLKCLWAPAAQHFFLQAYAALTASYLEGVSWEPTARIEERATRLLPALLLARVDGKSPVEYLTERNKDTVRRVARALLASPVQELSAVSTAWSEEIGNE